MLVLHTLELIGEGVGTATVSLVIRLLGRKRWVWL